jgi:hypothetical protein
VKVKQIDEFVLPNEFATAPDRIISGDDRTHRLVISWIYKFPFGLS